MGSYLRWIDKLHETLSIIKDTQTCTSAFKEKSEDLLGICFHLVRCDAFENRYLTTHCILLISELS